MPTHRDSIDESDAPSNSDLRTSLPLTAYNKDHNTNISFDALPAELRNRIYEYVARDEKIIVHPDDDGNSFSLSLDHPSPLHDVSRRIQGEYVDIALNTAPTIETTVSDYDFRHAAAFLDCITESRVMTLPAMHYATRRRFIIKPDLSHESYWNSDSLYQWLMQSGRDDARWSHIAIEYEVASYTRGFVLWNLYQKLDDFIIENRTSWMASEAKAIKHCVRSPLCRWIHRRPCTGHVTWYGLDPWS